MTDPILEREPRLAEVAESLDELKKIEGAVKAKRKARPGSATEGR